MTAEDPPVVSDSDRQAPLLVVSGPTASGKSVLGVMLAQALNGAIVSLDSVQCVQGFDVGSAKPSAADRALVPHYCVDLFPPDTVVTAQRLVEEAHACIAEIERKGLRPIVVGGSTMYLSALLEGLAPVPQVSKAVREELATLSTEALYTELQRNDPELAARLAPQDRQRIERGVSVYRATGQPLSAFHRTHQATRAMRSAIVLVPVWPRELLYRRINQRAGDMCAHGILAETRSLMEQFGSGIHSLRALGYAQSVQVLSGELPEEALMDRIAMETRRFAKRQLTYFKNEPRKRGWVTRPSEGGGNQVERTAKVRTQDLPALSWTFPQLLTELKGSRAASAEVWFVQAESLFGHL